MAVLLVLALLLQGLAMAGHWSRHSSDGAPALSITANGGDCVSGRGADGDLPSQPGEHSACCVLCGARGLDGALLQVFALAETWLLPSIERETVVAQVYDAPRNFPSGFRTSWSAQAPPIPQA